MTELHTFWSTSGGGGVNRVQATSICLHVTLFKFVLLFWLPALFNEELKNYKLK
jgi:hypothetical protein